MVSQIALHPFCYTYISLHIRQLLSHFSLNITLCIILCILLSVFYVLIHALCVSVHFRAISKCYHKYQKLIKGVLEDILPSLRLSVIETTSLGALLCLHYGESKFSLYMQAIRLVCEHLLCRHTPFKIQNPCVMYKVFICFLCGCSLVRVSTRWWTLMVAPISIPYASVRVFSHGVFRCCPLRSFPCALVPQGLPPWGVVVQGNSGGLLSLPVILWVTFSLSAVASPSPVFWGGGERE